jgi:lambda family phage holin
MLAINIIMARYFYLTGKKMFDALRSLSTALTNLLGAHLLSFYDAFISGTMALLHAAYLDISGRRRLLNAAICALLAYFIRDLILLMSWNINWANIFSVVLGFLGTDYIAILFNFGLDKLGVKK